MSGSIVEAPHAGLSGSPFVASVVGSPSVFDGESEEALALRYGRKRREQPEVTFEFTREPDLLHQYFRIYRAECTILEGDEQAEVEYNRNGHILIVRQGSLVVGGVRLYTTTPRLQRKLLLEENNFDLKEHFPELEQKQMKYGEITRLVLLPEFRGLALVEKMFANIYRKGMGMGLDWLFATATLPNARFYRQVSKSMGLAAAVHMDVDYPCYPGCESKYYLFSINKAGSKLNEALMGRGDVPASVRSVKEVC